MLSDVKRISLWLEWRGNGRSVLLAHCDLFEFLELAEEVLDQMSPFIHFPIQRLQPGAPWEMGNDSRIFPFVEFSDDGVTVERFVSMQVLEFEAHLSCIRYRISTRFLPIRYWKLPHGAGSVGILGPKVA